MGKLGLGEKINPRKPAPAKAEQGVAVKLSRQPEPPRSLAKAIARAVEEGPVEARPRRPARAAPAQIVVRSSEKFRRALKRWALDENTSTQDLIVTALRELHRTRGLGDLPE